MLAAGLLGGGVTAAVLLGTGAAGDDVTRTVVEAPPLEATASPTAASGALSAREIYRRDAPGVVLVRARSVQGEASSFDLAQRPQNVASGSGFVIDEEGHLLTSAHVVAGATDIHVTFSASKTVPARVVGKDEATDLAVLEVDPAAVALDPLPLGTLRRGPGRRPDGLDRQPVRPRQDADHRHRLRPPGAHHRAQRALDRGRAADRHRGQPGERRRSADRLHRPRRSASTRR